MELSQQCLVQITLLRAAPVAWGDRDEMSWGWMGWDDILADPAVPGHWARWFSKTRYSATAPRLLQSRDASNTTIPTNTILDPWYSPLVCACTTLQRNHYAPGRLSAVSPYPGYREFRPCGKGDADPALWNGFGLAMHDASMLPSRKSAGHGRAQCPPRPSYSSHLSLNHSFITRASPWFVRSIARPSPSFVAALRTIALLSHLGTNTAPTDRPKRRDSLP